jgi:deoxycytidine triphosphate deaminase
MVDNEMDKAPEPQDMTKELAAIPSNKDTATSADTPQNHRKMIRDNIVCQHRFEEDCRGHQTGLLTADEIQKYKIIKGHDDVKCLKTTSYDLRLGEGHLVFDCVSKKWEALWVGDEKSVYKYGTNRYKIIREGVLTIPAFGMALIQLREDIDLLSCVEDSMHPVFICGHFDLKLKRVAQGLISQQATQVEPGYQGKLFCYLFNQTGDVINLDYSENKDNKIATIEFQYVSCIAQCSKSVQDSLRKKIKEQHEKYKEPYCKDYCKDHGIIDVRYFERADGEIDNLPQHGGLSSFAQRLNDVKKEAIEGCKEEITKVGMSVGVMRGWLIVVISAALTIISILGKPLLDIYVVHYENEVRTKIENVSPKLEQMISRADDAINKLQKETFEAEKTSQQNIPSFPTIPKKAMSFPTPTDIHSIDTGTEKKGITR